MLKKTKKSKAPATKKKGKSKAPSKKPSKKPSCACVSTLAGFTAQVTSAYTLAPAVKTITICPGTTIDIPVAINVPAASLPNTLVTCNVYPLTVKCGCGGAKTCGLNYSGTGLIIPDAPISFGAASSSANPTVVSITIDGISLSSGPTSPSPSFFQTVSDQNTPGCFNRCTTNMSPNTASSVGVACSTW